MHSETRLIGKANKAVIKAVEFTGAAQHCFLQNLNFQIFSMITRRAWFVNRIILRAFLYHMRHYLLICFKLLYGCVVV